MHARKRARLCARAYAYVRVKRLKPVTSRDNIAQKTAFFRLADPAFWGFLSRYAAPQPPFLPRWPPFSRKFSPENPAPVCFLPRSARLFRPICARPPRHSAPDRAPVCAAHRPAFRPGDPGFARPGTSAQLPRPGHPGFCPTPTQTSPLRRGEGLCDPQGASDPWPRRLETAAQVRVKFREIGAPGV